MSTISSYKHNIASHCESGSVRNLLQHAGVSISETMAFGIGSGIDFIYLFFAKGVSQMPLCAVRAQMGEIFKNVGTLCNINFFNKKFKTTDLAIEYIDRKLSEDVPVAVCVDMFYMKYLPPFLQIHVPFHFIVLFGKEDGIYKVSDPYNQEIGDLTEEYLRLAISTNAKFANNNLVIHVDSLPDKIDWKNATLKAMKNTIKKMNPPALFNLLKIMGVEGIRTFAKSINQWTEKYEGLPLREGILHTATGFEEQGTGGGAFRLMYGAFLRETAELWQSSCLKELGDRMVENGLEWRECSRELIRIGKTIPRSSREYPDWYDKNGEKLNKELKEASELFMKRAKEEEKMLKDLGKCISGLK